MTFRSSWRDVDWKIYLVWAGLEAAFLLVLVALYSSPWESDLPYLAATAVIALALLLAAFFIRVLRTGIGRDYTLTFGGDEIQARNDLGQSSTTPWSAVKTVTLGRQFLVIRSTTGTIAIVPVRHLGAGAKEFADAATERALAAKSAPSA